MYCFETSMRQGQAQPSSRIHRPPINPPAPIDQQLDFNNSAQAQVAATSPPGLSHDPLSAWLQLQITNQPSGQGVSASSPSHSWAIVPPAPARLNRTMVEDPDSWFVGETLPAIGDEMCYWAPTTCNGNAGTRTLATKACHFKTNHRPRCIYACSSCVVKHRASFDEVLDL
jgi:hypothetical protein